MFCEFLELSPTSQPITEVFVRECQTRPASDDIMGVDHKFHLEEILALVKKLPELRADRLPGARAPRSTYDKTMTTGMSLR